MCLKKQSLILLLVSSPLFGGSFLSQSDEDAITSAPNVVRGTVGDHVTQESPDTEGIFRLYTVYELRITEVLKSSAPIQPGSLYFRELGGEKNGIRTVIPGAAEFKPGEDILVLLKGPNNNAVFDLVGMHQGKFQIQDEVVGIRKNGDPLRYSDVKAMFGIQESTKLEAAEPGTAQAAENHPRSQNTLLTSSVSIIGIVLALRLYLGRRKKI